MSLLNFNFVMIYIIHKIFILLKNNLNYWSIFEVFLRRIIDFFKKTNKKFITYSNGKIKSWKNFIIKDIINLFRLKKELNKTAVKDMRYLFSLEKETKAI